MSGDTQIVKTGNSLTQKTQRQPMNRPTAYLSINSKVDRKGTALPCPYQCADKYRYDDD